MILSLEVDSWPIINMSAQNIHRVELVHFESRLSTSAAAGSDPEAIVGESLWAGMSAHGLVGVSWHWGQVGPGVFALVDPMRVSSNLLLLASDGSRLSASARAMVHNRMLADLPWQAQAALATRLGGQRSIDSLVVVPAASMRPS